MDMFNFDFDEVVELGSRSRGTTGKKRKWREIKALKDLYNIQEIAYDRWNASQVSQHLQGAGIVMVQMGQGFASLNAPSKELLRLLLAGKLAHGGNPVLRWMADNTAARQDAAGNIKPDKAKSTGRIDGIVASVMALARSTLHNPTAGTSVYSERGVLAL